LHMIRSTGLDHAARLTRAQGPKAARSGSLAVQRAAEANEEAAEEAAGAAQRGAVAAAVHAATQTGEESHSSDGLGSASDDGSWFVVDLACHRCRHAQALDAHCDLSEAQLCPKLRPRTAASWHTVPAPTLPRPPPLLPPRACRASGWSRKHAIARPPNGWCRHTLAHRFWFSLVARLLLHVRDSAALQSEYSDEWLEFRSAAYGQIEAVLRDWA